MDLDETLIHASYEPMYNPDFMQHVGSDSKRELLYVKIRPGCREFISRMAIHYELVMFTASVPGYARPIYEKVDLNGVTSHLLFREHCSQYKGMYVKDLAKLNRSLKDVIIMDNSRNSYLFQPDNAIACTSFFDDEKD